MNFVVLAIYFLLTVANFSVLTFQYYMNIVLKIPENFNLLTSEISEISDLQLRIEKI